MPPFLSSTAGTLDSSGQTVVGIPGAVPPFLSSTLCSSPPVWLQIGSALDSCLAAVVGVGEFLRGAAVAGEAEHPVHRVDDEVP